MSYSFTLQDHPRVGNKQMTGNLSHYATLNNSGDFLQRVGFTDIEVTVSC